MKRTVLFSLAVVVILSALLSACQGTPKELKQTGRTYDVTFRAERSQSVWVYFDESEYTRAFTYVLDDSFANFDDQTWWNRLAAEVQYLYDEERAANESIWIYKIPSAEWLQNNIKREEGKPYISVHMLLPKDGILRKEVTNKTYANHTEDGKFKKDLQAMQIVVGGKMIHSLWDIYAHPIDKERTKYAFTAPLDDLQECYNHRLIYRFKNGEIILIEIPEDLFSLTPEDLPEDGYTLTIQTEILK